MKGLAEAEAERHHGPGWSLAWVVRLGGEPVPAVKMPAAA